MYQLTKPDNVVEILEKSVSKFPQRPFLGTKNKRLKQYDWITFSDFGKRVDNVRSGLSQLGIAKDDAVHYIQ
jgi:long-subunit acyl-CoA synthetase (AMP-forming)